MFDVNVEKNNMQAEIDKLRAAIKEASKAINSMFWEGGIDQEDAEKLKEILHGAPPRESMADRFGLGRDEKIA